MSNRNVFLVDDDNDDRNIFQFVLTTIDNTASLTSAQDGVHAFELINGNGFTKPDIIFLDLNMPRMNGIEFLTEIRKMKEFEGIPVIIFSTNIMKEQAAQCIALGARECVTKPDTVETQIVVMKELLKKYP
jgi:CheY-like chemotaxis protein